MYGQISQFDAIVAAIASIVSAILTYLARNKIAKVINGKPKKEN